MKVIRFLFTFSLLCLVLFNLKNLISHVRNMKLFIFIVCLTPLIYGLLYLRTVCSTTADKVQDRMFFSALDSLSE